MNNDDRSSTTNNGKPLAVSIPAAAGAPPSSAAAVASTPGSSSPTGTSTGLQMTTGPPRNPAEEGVAVAAAATASSPPQHRLPQQSSPRWGRPSSTPTLPASSSPSPVAAAAAATAAAAAMRTPSAAMRTPLLDHRERRRNSSSIAAAAGEEEGDEEMGGHRMRPLTSVVLGGLASNSSSSSSASSSSSSASAPGGGVGGSSGLTYRGARHSPLPVQQASRLVERNGKRTGQAKTRWNVTRVGRWSIQDNLESILFDSFNQLLMAPPYYTLIALAASYLLIVFAFAAIYVAIAADGNCGMEISSLLDGYYFSLETMATVGYGVKDEFFEDCKSPAFFITLQVLTALLFESCTLGLVFIRFSRPGKRALTVLFSDQATLAPLVPATTTATAASTASASPPPLALSFRITELTRYELIEPRVRLYAVRHCRNPAGGNPLEDRLFFHAFPLKLHAPADGLLLMTLPASVTHVLDADSPLLPPGWARARGDGSSSGGSGTGLVGAGERAALEAFWQEEEAEVVVLVEGTDPLTSNSLQAKFSYKLPQDVAWNSAFAPCVGARHRDGGCVVDLTRFHATRALVAEGGEPLGGASVPPAVHV